jgi:hypothetical protein
LSKHAVKKKTTRCYILFQNAVVLVAAFRGRLVLSVPLGQAAIALGESVAVAARGAQLARVRLEVWVWWISAISLGCVGTVFFFFFFFIIIFFSHPDPSMRAREE